MLLCKPTEDDVLALWEVRRTGLMPFLQEAIKLGLIKSLMDPAAKDLHNYCKNFLGESWLGR